MGIQVSCPHCAQPVDPQARYCKNCGVDLALAALVAERAVIDQPQIPAGISLAPEILVPRMGDYMVERGMLAPEELQRALEYQQERNTAGHPLLLGQALLELGLIQQETLDQVITVQILKLQTALSDANRQLEQRVQERTLDLQNALDRLAELNQLKSNFVANISHELRTPLTHIKGYLDLLSDGGLGPLNPNQAQAVSVLRRAEARLEQLIEDLIQFSLASRGELSLKLGMTRLGDLIKIIVKRSKQKARSSSVSLKVNLADRIPPVRADEEKIGWVILQLIDNAIKFTPQGGRVEVEAHVDNGIMTVAVSDSGIGIPAEKIREIFEPFHQLDSSTTRRYGGTGLGLAMVRRILEAHGSEIKVQSVVGIGSRFEFSLPTSDGKLVDDYGSNNG